MTHKKVFTIQYRRKREGRTDYRHRLVVLKSKIPRLTVRKSNKHMLAQLIEYADKGDKIVKVAHTKELKKYGWDTNCANIPASYLVGLLIGVKAKGKEAILDIGLQAPIKGSRLFAVLKGAVDGGLKINLSEEVLPTEDRIKGKHIVDFAKHTEKHKEKFERIFSGYLKNKKDPAKLQEYFEKTKEKILSE